MSLIVPATLVRTVTLARSVACSSTDRSHVCFDLTSSRCCSPGSHSDGTRWRRPVTEYPLTSFPNRNPWLSSRCDSLRLSGCQAPVCIHEATLLDGFCRSDSLQSRITCVCSHFRCLARGNCFNFFFSQKQLTKSIANHQDQHHHLQIASGKCAWSVGWCCLLLNGEW